MTFWTTYESPLGPLTFRATAHGLAGLDFPGHEDRRAQHEHRPAAFDDAAEALDRYFAGEQRDLALPLDLTAGTDFQRRVWSAIAEIPFGATVTYTELARALGRPDRVRAVAAAVGRTPVPIVIPCHRVVGASGALTGYLGGLQRKRALLDHESGISQLTLV